MIIAVMSDSHDNIWNLRRALEIVSRKKAGMILHCGDFVAPFMLKELAAAGLPVHGVFGNNDGDQHQLTRLALTELTRIHLHGLVAELDVDGFRIALTHYYAVGRGLALSKRYDLVCYGHSHVQRLETVGATPLLNPGEIMGKEGRPGFCTVDTANGAIAEQRLR